VSERKKKIGLAITSLVFGVLALLGSCVLLNVILGPLAILFGIIALVKAFKHPDTHSGKILAGFGLGLGAFSMVTLPIVAAIAIPNFIAALNRARQHRTTADMKVVALSIDEYAVNEGIYPDSGAVWVPVKDLSAVVSMKENLSLKDAWDQDLMYWSDAFQEHYLLVSKAGDHEMDAHTWKEYQNLANRAGGYQPPGRDIVICDGAFILFPETARN